MAVSASGLVTEIINNFPSTWDYSDPAQANRTLLDTLASGFVTMWTAGIMTPGPGPPPGPNPHTHTILTLVPATLVSGVAALGLGPLVVPWTTAIATAVSTHLIASAVMDVQDGTVSHKHLFTGFGADSVLKSAILTAVAGVGFNTTEPLSAQDPWAGGFSTGLLAHLTANADMVVSLGAAHVHVLL